MNPSVTFDVHCITWLVDFSVSDELSLHRQLLLGLLVWLGKAFLYGNLFLGLHRQCISDEGDAKLESRSLKINRLMKLPGDQNAEECMQPGAHLACPRSVRAVICAFPWVLVIGRLPWQLT